MRDYSTVRRIRGMERGDVTKVSSFQSDLQSKTVKSKADTDRWCTYVREAVRFLTLLASLSLLLLLKGSHKHF